MHTVFLHGFKDARVLLGVEVIASVLHVYGSPPSLLLPAQKVCGGLALLDRVALGLPIAEGLLDAHDGVVVLALEFLFEVEELI